MTVNRFKTAAAIVDVLGSMAWQVSEALDRYADMQQQAAQDHQDALAAAKEEAEKARKAYGHVHVGVDEEQAEQAERAAYEETLAGRLDSLETRLLAMTSSVATDIAKLDRALQRALTEEPPVPAPRHPYENVDRDYDSDLGD